MSVFFKRLLLLFGFNLLCGVVFAQHHTNTETWKESDDSLFTSFIESHVDIERLKGNQFFLFRYHHPVLLCIKAESCYYVYVGEPGRDEILSLTFPPDMHVFRDIFDFESNSKNKAEKDYSPPYWNLIIYDEDGYIIDKMDSLEHSIPDIDLKYLNLIIMNYLLAINAI